MKPTVRDIAFGNLISRESDMADIAEVHEIVACAGGGMHSERVVPFLARQVASMSGKLHEALTEFKFADAYERVCGGVHLHDEAYTVMRAAWRSAGCPDVEEFIREHAKTKAGAGTSAANATKSATGATTGHLAMSAT